MKLMTQSKKFLVVVAVMAFAGFAGLAHAETSVDVELIAPTGTIEVQGFPANVDVKLAIMAINKGGSCSPSDVNEIVVKADEVVIHTNESPGLTNDACDDPAEYQFTWQVTAPGTYGLEIYVKAFGGQNLADDTEEESVTFMLVAVEWPAPPSVANAYIKSNCQKLKGGAHGAIISEIAHRFNAGLYNDKPGPYDVDGIQADVRNLGAICTL